MSESKRPRASHPERVTLSQVALLRIDRLIEDARMHLAGAPITRADVANWLLERRDDGLSANEIKALRTKFFDPILAFEWAARRIKEAQATGESAPMKELIGSALLAHLAGDGVKGCVEKAVRSRRAKADASADAAKLPPGEACMVEDVAAGGGMNHSTESAKCLDADR